MNWNDLQKFIDPLWIKWITGIVGSGGSALLGAFLQRVKIKSPLKRLWKFHDVHTTTVCISESFQSQETMKQYTGIGQVKAFGLIVESIGRAYSLQMKIFPFQKMIYRIELKKI